MVLHFWTMLLSKQPDSQTWFSLPCLDLPFWYSYRAASGGSGRDRGCLLRAGNNR